jgi:elongation factor 1-alpha
MITGTSQADAAVLNVAANDGVNAQTKEHAFLARVLGVQQLIVNVNKMDISGVDWSQDKYNSVVEEVTGLLKMAGFPTDDIPFIPCSAFDGDNVYNRSDKSPWYDGPTLFEAIDAIKMPPKPTDMPLRLPI